MRQQPLKRTDQTAGFWHGGIPAFHDTLTRQEKDLLAPLLTELETTLDAARTEILNNQIKAIKDDFKTKRKDAKYSLFGKNTSGPLT